MALEEWRRAVRPYLLVKAQTLIWPEEIILLEQMRADLEGKQRMEEARKLFLSSSQNPIDDDNTSYLEARELENLMGPLLDKDDIASQVLGQVGSQEPLTRLSPMELKERLFKACYQMTADTFKEIGMSTVLAACDGDTKKAVAQGLYSRAKPRMVDPIQRRLHDPCPELGILWAKDLEWLRGQLECWGRRMRWEYIQREAGEEVTLFILEGPYPLAALNELVAPLREAYQKADQVDKPLFHLYRRGVHLTEVMVSSRAKALELISKVEAVGLIQCKGEQYVFDGQSLGKSPGEVMEKVSKKPHLLWQMETRFNSILFEHGGKAVLKMIKSHHQSQDSLADPLALKKVMASLQEMMI